jgi:CBS domain-containing membrane protein
LAVNGRPRAKDAAKSDRSPGPVRHLRGIRGGTAEREALPVAEAAMILKVKDLMTRDVETISEDETMDFAKTVMTLGRIRHLPVTDREGRLIGLVTHRDLLRALAEVYRDIGPNGDEDRIEIRAIMNTDVVTIGPEEPAVRAAEMIWRHKFGCLPVVEAGRLVGIVTESDFVHMAMQQLSDPRV